MKVLRVTTELNYGGIEKVFELHAKHHDKTYELVFVALGKGGNTQRVLQDLGYKVIVLGFGEVTIPSVEIIRALIKVIKAERPEVVHTAGAEANFHATLAAKIASVKRIICEEIGIPGHSAKAKLLFRFIYKLSDGVIAISRAVKEFLITSKEVPASKVTLIYNPVNSPGQNIESNREELRFAVVARLEPVKNLPFLIDVFSELLKKKPNAKLIIIGDGSQRKMLREKINKLNISDKVSMKGFLPDPQQELTKSTFFILPSLFEGFGLACIEAIQAGNVVVCTNSGGIPEFIDDGQEGFLFNPNSKESMLTAIDKALSLSKSEKEIIVASAQKRVRDLFSPTLYVEQLKSLYYA